MRSRAWAMAPGLVGSTTTPWCSVFMMSTGPPFLVATVGTPWAAACEAGGGSSWGWGKALPRRAGPWRQLTGRLRQPSRAKPAGCSHLLHGCSRTAVPAPTSCRCFVAKRQCLLPNNARRPTLAFCPAHLDHRQPKGLLQRGVDKHTARGCRKVVDVADLRLGVVLGVGHAAAGGGSAAQRSAAGQGRRLVAHEMQAQWQAAGDCMLLPLFELSTSSMQGCAARHSPSDGEISLWITQQLCRSGRGYSPPHLPYRSWASMSLSTCTSTFWLPPARESMLSRLPCGAARKKSREHLCGVVCVRRKAVGFTALVAAPASRPGCFHTTKWSPLPARTVLAAQWPHSHFTAAQTHAHAAHS